MKKVKKEETMQTALKTLTRPSLKLCKIVDAGEKLILNMYGAPAKIKTLDALRVALYTEKRNSLRLV